MLITSPINNNVRIPLINRLKMIKNVLITGGAGFIGSSISIKLISKGYNVTVLDNLSPQIHGENSETSYLYNIINGKVQVIKGDVRNRSDWQKSIKNQDAIVHLAAETGTGQSMYQISKYTETNIGGTSMLLDILANEQHTIKKVIIASSRAIYGEGKYSCAEHGIVYPNERSNDFLAIGDFECKCPVCNRTVELMTTDEESKIHPASVYGITKYNQEQMILTVCKSIGISAVSFRYQNVYGPGQSLSNPYTGILSIFSTQIKNGNNINIFEDGKESRDFVYIDDVVDATILGIEKDNSNSEVFNVGSGTAIDVFSVANILKNQYQSSVQILLNGIYRLGDIRHNVADVSKIQTKLGFKAKYDFNTGIRNFVEWVNSQNIQTDNYQKSIDEMQEKDLLKKV